MPSRNKAIEAQSSRDTSPNIHTLPDIESMVEGMDEVEARRIADSAWEPAELPYFLKRAKPESRVEPEEDKAEIFRVADYPWRSENSSSPARTSTSTPRTSVDIPNDFSKSRSTYTTYKRDLIYQKSHTELKDGEVQKEGTKGDITDKLANLFFEDDTSISLPPGTQRLKVRQEEQEKREREEKAKAAEVRKNRRLLRQAPLRPLVAPLGSKWDEAISDLRRKAISQEIVKGHKGTPLARKDFETLLGAHSWLNDEIINAYLEWVVAAANAAAKADAEKHGEPASTVPKFIAQNSFFHNTLSTKGADSTTRMMKRLGAPVGSSFLEVDSMLVPICRHSHWTIGVVRPVAKTIEYFDSMGNPGARIAFAALMRDWLKHQLGDLYKEDEWTVPLTACAHQNNGWDCGVFVCTNAFCIAMGVHTDCYLEHDMVQQRRNIAAVLLNRGFVKEFEWTEAGLLA